MIGVPDSKAKPPLKDGAETRPDYSPAMLRLFLRARVVALADRFADDAGRPSGPRTDFRNRARRELSSSIRREARVTHVEFDMALRGRLQTPAKRAAIWGALGVVVDRELSREAG